MTASHKRLAALISEYRPHSHADVIVGRFLGGYWYEGQHHEPGARVVSMYTDQVPDQDMSRDLAAQHGFRLVPSIRHALTGVADESYGARQLDVDGVLLIAEHGAYPYNPLGQKLYPRYEFFRQVVDVFRETGQVAPVFCDKHLSWDWLKGRRMVDESRELGFPLMAGSVLPLAHPPELGWESGRPIRHAVQLWHADFVGNKDSYGFHALEELQCRVERRAGGETGVRAVQCLEGQPVWQWTDAHRWSARLLEATTHKTVAQLQNVEDPMAFVLHYDDGIEAVVYRLNGIQSESEFAAIEADGTAPVVLPSQPVQSCAIDLPDKHRSRYPVANHFAAEVRLIDDMVAGGGVRHPVERTLLTTGVLAALHESSYQAAENYGRTYQHGRLLKEGRLIDTPHLCFAYTPPSVTT